MPKHLTPEDLVIAEFHERFPLSEPKVARLGNMVAMYHGWGQYQNQAQWLTQRPNLTAIQRETVLESGFVGGQRVDPDVDVRSPEFQKFQAGIVTETAALAARERHWHHLDYLIVSSLSFKPENLALVGQQLRRKGIAVDHILFYGQACNGMIAAIVDACLLPTMRGKQVVITAIENLSGNIIDPNDFQTAWTFSNKAASFAFLPGFELNILNAHTVIERDEMGVIQVPHSYDLPPIDQRQVPPPWYEIKDNARDHFAYSAQGSRLLMPLSQNTAVMNAWSVFKYFGKRVPPVITPIVLDYWANLAPQHGPLGPSLAHHAARKVLEGIQHKLDHATDQRGYPRTNSPWVFNEKVLSSNTSSSTAGVVLVEMIERGLIEPDVAFLLMGYGVGSAITGAIGKVQLKRRILR